MAQTLLNNARLTCTEVCTIFLAIKPDKILQFLDLLMLNQGPAMAAILNLIARGNCQTFLFGLLNHDQQNLHQQIRHIQKYTKTAYPLELFLAFFVLCIDCKCSSVSLRYERFNVLSDFISHYFKPNLAQKLATILIKYL